ncbi:P-loop containing nucleoside triphosphate hydrolase protein, partial [Mycena vulgaris]
KQCGNDVDSALSIFQAKLQIDLFKTIRDLRNDVGDLRSAVSPHANLIANLNSTSASFLPPSPSIFYGRSAEVDHVVNLVLNHAPARVAIVGSGGIGKTSIALTSIHHPEVEKYFLNQHFFLSCEAVITAESLALDLLKLFGLSADSSGSRSASDILVLFAQSMTLKCLLCLDNFETPWDSDKDHVELLLAKIAVPHLTLIITSRDSDRPRGIKWTAPLLPPIQPLTVSAALETWNTISHGHDEFSLLLINAVDCIPLAVTLLSQLAESDSAEALWASWETESTKLVKSDGSAHRLNNLELSIELSLQGPRLRACPGALDFFIILCMLPQGLPELRIPEFETSFRNHFGGTRSAIRVLKQCSLAYSLEGFLRVLSPVRQYTQDHPDLTTTL